MIVLVLNLSAPAMAAERINIDFVEPSADGSQMSILVGIPQDVTPDLDSVRVELDALAVPATADEVMTGDIQRTVVLALDASNSMARDQKFASAKAAAKAFIADVPADVEIGLLTFSDTVNVIAEPSTDHTGVANAIDGLSLTLGTRVYDAVQQAVDVAGSSGARSVLLLSDGKDEGNGTSIDEAIRAALDNGVVVDVVALDQEPTQRALMTNLAESTGGDVIASDPDSLAAAFAAQAELLSTQLLITVQRPADDRTEADLRVSLVAQGQAYSDTALVRLPVRAQGARPVAPPSMVVGGGFLWVGALILAVGLAGIAWLMLVTERGPSLAMRQIEHYSRGDQAPLQSQVGPDPGHAEKARIDLREQALTVAQGLLRGSFETRLTERLTSSGLSITSAEWLLLHAAVLLSSGLIGLVLSGPVFMVVLMTFGLVVPWAYLGRRARKRLDAFHAQLAATLQLIAGGLSAGLSAGQAIETVVREGSEPIAGELRRVLIEQRLGIDITDALGNVAERMHSQDFAWVVMAMRIQREVGGNLAELLTTVSETLREREYLRRQVGVLSAEGRVSAWILGALPVLMFTYVAAFRPEFIKPLLTEPLGMAMLGVGIALLAGGAFVLSRIVKVEV